MSENKELNSFFIVMMFFFVLFLNQSWVPGMFMDGLIYGALAKSMMETGNYLVPYLSDNYYPVFFEHPPFWMQYLAVFFKVFKAGWVELRVANFFVIFLMIAIIYRTLKNRYSKYEAFFSCVFLAICFPFFKKARIPLIETPLMFFSLISILFYYQAYLYNKWRDWLSSGIFFGLAMLVKGVPSFYILISIFLHTLFTKNYKNLYNYKAYASLVLGLCVFLMWPLSLYLNESFYIFERWNERQFIGTVLKARGVQENDYFMYVKGLLKTVAPWLIVTGLGLKRLRKNRDDFYLLLFCSFLGVLIPFSMAKFKYSHYILPSYIFLSMMVGIEIKKLLRGSALLRFKKTLTYLIVTASLVLLVFPLTSKQRRNINEQLVLDALKNQKIEASHWLYFNGKGGMWDKISFLNFTKKKGEKLFIEFYEEFDDQELREKSIVVLKNRVRDDSFHLLNSDKSSHYYCYKCF